ncbi:MAG: universal stress protein [Propionibacteriales bacterium]|jgi:nucleotide-binding universal stress UspA family protein|nr:universal stress protein [Propionibacteriales bacterium]
MDQSAAIVIGYDSSVPATAALRRGLELAAFYQVPARVVRAWTTGTAPRPKTWEPGYVPPVDDFAAAVIEQVGAEIAGLIAEFGGVEVRIEAPHGPAGRELIEASAQAQLVVVAARNLHGISELLLGSVSKEVVEHSHCDVLVVRPQQANR